MKRCGARTRDLYAAKGHVCGLPAGPRRDGTPCRVHACKEEEPWGECLYGWIDGVERTPHDDLMALGWKTEIWEGRETRLRPIFGDRTA